MLGTRILTAAVLVPLVLAALFLLPAPGWAVASLGVTAIGAVEWANLSGLGPKARIAFVTAVGLTGIALLAARSGTMGEADAVLAICGAATFFWMVVAPPWIVRRWKATPVVTAFAGWVALTGAWVALVYLQERSPWLVLAAMAIVWIADTAAYFTGRAFGRRKLAPEVSPGKTWEGVYGALAAVAVYAIALVPKAQSAGFSGVPSAAAIGVWIASSLVLVALSVEGDLFESLLKRHAGVKDSGWVLPGHGGILDRIDALLAAMPAAALYAYACLR